MPGCHRPSSTAKLAAPISLEKFAARISKISPTLDRCEARYRALTWIGSLLIGLALAGCGGKSSSVELQGGMEGTGGKALFFTATTGEELAQAKVGSNLALELRGINVTRTPRATYDHADYVGTRCAGPPCEWTVAPDEAARYEFRAFLVDLRNGKSAGQSDPVQAAWDAPPRPRGLKLLINGKEQPITPLESTTDDYIHIPAGKLRVEAVWNGDASGTGYEVAITNSQPPVDETCSTGTSCRVPAKVPILDSQEMSWVVKVQTTSGHKLVSSFKVCLEGRA